MTTLASMEARISARLVDAANAVYSLATIDEALRSALAEYSAAVPLSAITTLTLAAKGREIDISSLTGLIHVLDVWWPYDPTTEIWPPNQVAGFRMWWTGSAPTLFLSSATANQPQINDKLRIWYTLQQHIQNLDGAGATTIFPLHESGLVTGAAAYAAASSEIDQIGTVRVDPSEVPALRQWANDRFVEFRSWLEEISNIAPPSGPPFGPGWGIDKWDSNRNPRQSRYPIW